MVGHSENARRPASDGSRDVPVTETGIRRRRPAVPLRSDYALSGECSWRVGRAIALYGIPTIRSELEWSSGRTCELCGSNAA